MTNKIFSALKVITLAIVLSFGFSYVYAWTAPSTTPPTGNVSAPINTGTSIQQKAGDLTVKGLVADTLTIGTPITSNAITAPKFCLGTSCITAWPAVGGGGTVTSLSAGTGIALSPNPITTTGTISANTAVVQSRVAGSCAVGNSISAINADGTVACGPSRVSCAQPVTFSSGTCMSGGLMTTLNCSGGYLTSITSVCYGYN